MSISRREFLQVLAIAAAGGMALRADSASAQAAADQFYDLPRFGNVHLLHFTDCHAQIKPVYFREPSVNLGVGAAKGLPPHLTGADFLTKFGIAPKSAAASCG